MEFQESNMASQTESEMPAEQSLSEVHASNVALWHTLSTPTSNRRALPPELIIRILKDPSRWVILRMVQEIFYPEYIFNNMIHRREVDIEASPLTVPVSHIGRIDLTYRHIRGDGYMGDGTCHHTKQHTFDIGIVKSSSRKNPRWLYGGPKPSKWHHVTADLISDEEKLYRGSISLGHPIFAEIDDGYDILVRTCLRIYDFACEVEVRMEIIGADYLTDL